MSRLAVSLLLLAACAAPQETHRTTPPGAGQPGATPAGAASPAGASGDEEVCTEESVTGSNIRRTVCRSQSQIDRERDSARQLRERSNMHPGPPIRD